MGKTVSVIIPYYNKPLTIERAVESVINQTYSNWELIIVDDCSEDRLQATKMWSYYPVQIFRNSQNLGAGATRQIGLQKSVGDYIAFLDADDWWSPHFLEKCLYLLVMDDHAAAAWVRSTVYTSKGEIKLRRYCEMPFTNIQETILQYTRPWQTGGILWRKSMCGEWGSLSTNEDYQFEFSSSLKSNNILPVGEALYHVDQAGGYHLSKSICKEESLSNSFTLYEYVYRNLRTSLSLKSKILLFHRIIRALLKITELEGILDSDRYWSSTESIYLFTKLFNRKPIVLKIVHSLLQRTPYRLYF